MGFPNGGEGGGGPPLGKNSHIFPLFFLGSVPNLTLMLLYEVSESYLTNNIYVHIYKAKV